MVEMSEKISVIVPVYNVEQYLEKCMESILNQTYKNIEVLLIDDGSTDKSGSICDFYAGKDNRVRVHHKENEGLSEARNIGVALASANYIVFVDSDDYIVPDMLEVLYNRMQEDKSDLAICNFLYVDESGKSIEDRNEKEKELIKECEIIKKELEKKEYSFKVKTGKDDILSNILLMKSKGYSLQDEH